MSSLFQTEVECDQEHLTCRERRESTFEHLNVFYSVSSLLSRSFSLGDGSVYVRNNDAVVPVPQVNGGLATTGALVLGCHAEHHLVGSVAQVQVPLEG